MLGRAVRVEGSLVGPALDECVQAGIVAALVERIAEAARRIEEERKAEAERKAGEIRRLRELALKRYEEEYIEMLGDCAGFPGTFVRICARGAGR